MTLLAVGIPTYNRERIVRENVRHILSDDFISDNNINLIVSDNNSIDDTFNSLKAVLESSKLTYQNLWRVKFNSNESNLGVFGNIFKLFEVCESKYLLITSDEDFLIKENIPRVISFLETESPTFVSPQAFIDGKLYRGSIHSEIIPLKKWHSAAFFTSGLIFDVQKTKEIIERLHHLLAVDNLYYVQTLLLCEFMVSWPRSQWYFDCPLVDSRFRERSEVSKTDAFRYWTVPGRWLGFLAVENYFKTRILESGDNRNKVLYEGFMEDNRNSLYSSFIHAITHTQHEAVEGFRSGVIRSEFGRFSIILIELRKIYHKIRKVIKGK
jgi:glycosyltransferase involved in cell wall biosynthesis